MKKLSVFLLISIIGIFIYTQRTVSQIKPVSYTTIWQIQHTEYITAGGELESSLETDILLSYPVCIKKVFVQENRYVNKGQALFSLDIDKMSKAAKGDISEDILNNISYDELADLKQNNIDISQLSNVIYAPENGVITSLNIYPGAVVLQNNTLISISHTDEIIARFSLSQQDFGKVSVGDKVDIIPVAYSDLSYQGKIIDKNAVVKRQNSATGSKVVVDVFAHIENPDKRIAGGLQINGKIQNGNVRTVNAIDYNYINQDDKGEFVFILKEGRAKKIYIDTGVEAENYTEILTEFRSDTLFLSGDIKEGSRVILSE